MALAVRTVKFGMSGRHQIPSPARPPAIPRSSLLSALGGQPSNNHPIELEVAKAVPVVQPEPKPRKRGGIEGRKKEIEWKKARSSERKKLRFARVDLWRRIVSRYWQFATGKDKGACQALLKAFQIFSVNPDLPPVEFFLVDKGKRIADGKSMVRLQFADFISRPAIPRDLWEALGLATSLRP